MNMNSTNNITGAMSQLVNSLCKHKVEVTADEGMASVTIIVSPHASDYGKVIGGGGENLKALNIIARAMAAKNGFAECDLIVPPQNNSPVPGIRFAMDPAWDNQALENLAVQVAAELFDGQIRIEWRKLTVDNSRLMMVVDNLPDAPGYPRFYEIAGALGRILGGVALSQGHRVKFELATIEYNAEVSDPAHRTGRLQPKRESRVR